MRIYKGGAGYGDDEAAEPVEAIDVSCYKASPVREVLPEALQAQHHVQATAEDVDALVDNIGPLDVGTLESCDSAYELEDESDEHQTLNVDIDLVEQYAACEHPHQVCAYSQNVHTVVVVFGAECTLTLVPKVAF